MHVEISEPDSLTDWAAQYRLPALRNLFTSVVGLSALVVTWLGMMPSIQIMSLLLCPINLQVSLFQPSTFLNHLSKSCWAVRDIVYVLHHIVQSVQRVGNEKSKRGLTMLLLQHLLPARASRDLPHRFFFSLKMITVNVATNNNVKHFDSQVSHETLNLQGPYAPLC